MLVYLLKARLRADLRQIKYEEDREQNVVSITNEIKIAAHPFDSRVSKEISLSVEEYIKSQSHLPNICSVEKC